MTTQMTFPTGKIPISAAKKVAEQFGLKQCLLIGWDGELAHIVTYGKTKADCEAAAKAQDFWQGKIKEFSFKGEAAGKINYDLPPRRSDS